MYFHDIRLNIMLTEWYQSVWNSRTDYEWEKQMKLKPNEKVDSSMPFNHNSYDNEGKPFQMNIQEQEKKQFQHLLNNGVAIWGCKTKSLWTTNK